MACSNQQGDVWRGKDFASWESIGCLCEYRAWRRGVEWRNEVQLHGAIHQREVVVRGPRERGRWWMRLLGVDEEVRSLCKREHLASCGLHAYLGHEGLRMEHREWSAAAATSSTWKALGRLWRPILPSPLQDVQSRENDVLRAWAAVNCGRSEAVRCPCTGKSSRPGSPEALGRSVALRFCCSCSCAACA